MFDWMERHSRLALAIFIGGCLASLVMIAWGMFGFTPPRADLSCWAPADASCPLPSPTLPR